MKVAETVVREIEDGIRERWTEWFEVERVVPESINWRQDAVFVRKPTA